MPAWIVDEQRLLTVKALKYYFSNPKNEPKIIDDKITFHPFIVTSYCHKYDPDTFHDLRMLDFRKFYEKVYINGLVYRYVTKEEMKRYNEKYSM